MHKLIILLLVLCLLSCTTTWDQMEKSEQTEAVILGTLSVFWIGGMTYLVVNPLDNDLNDIVLAIKQGGE